ncbi:MAG TPA: cytochrome c oxidase assembly protein [Trebonia sp.]|nr:cytochrome c oxidase assembly protein [Trebonia sp.]
MSLASALAHSTALPPGIALRYAGPPPLTPARAFSGWTADVPVIVVVVLLAAAYLAGMRRVRRGGGTWPAGRAVTFCGLGLGFAVYATMSWVGVYQGTLFYARATQTVLLVLVIPLFLALGRPLTLLGAAVPGSARVTGAVVRSRVARLVTFPAITTFGIIAVPFVMYFTTWYTHSLQNAGLRELTYLVLMAPGYLYFWTFLRVDPVPREYNRAVSMWITAAQVVGDAFFGIAVIADQNLIALPYYQGLHRPFGPSFATDQVLGGGVLWILGDFVGLPFLAAQFIHAMREDKEQAAIIDAELDARDAAREAAREAREAASPAADTTPGAGGAPVADVAAGPSAPPGLTSAEPVSSGHMPDDAPSDGAPAPAGTAPAEVVQAEVVQAEAVPDDAGRLWWEDDSRFTDRFKRA